MPVYLERRSMTLDQTLAAVAFGFRASVVASPHGIRITRGPDDRRKMLTDVRLFWLQHLTSWFEESKRQLKDAAIFGSQDKQYKHYSEILSHQFDALRHRDSRSMVTVTVSPMDLTPIGVLYSRIAQRIGAERLVEIRPDERRIWSDQPEASQRFCPKGDALLREYADGQRSFLAKTEPDRTFQEPRRFTFRQVGGTHFNLTIYNSAGAAIGRYGGPPFDFPMAGPILLSPNLAAHAFNGELAEWSPVNKAAFDQFLLPTGRTGLSPVPPGFLPPFVTHPDKVDPLDFETRTGFAGIGIHVKAKGFVVIPTDQMLEVANGCMENRKLNITAFDNILRGQWEYERSNVQGVTVLRCRDPYQWQRNTVNRENLAEQIRTLMSLDNIGTTSMAEVFFRLFPQGDSRVARLTLNAIVATRPHAIMNLEGVLAEYLAWFGAALAQCGDRRIVEIDPSIEPFKSLINRGINSGWIRFKSEVPATDEDLDPAVIFDSRATSPKLAILIGSTPMFSYVYGSSPVPESDISGLYPARDLAESLAGTVINRYGVNYQLHPDLIPSQERIIAKIRQDRLFHVGISTDLTVDLLATPTLRFQGKLDEQRLTQTNLTFDQLPRDLQGLLLKSTLDWIRLFVQGKVGQGTTFNDPPRVQNSPPPSP